MLGGDIEVVGSGLYALEGRLDLGAVAGMGEVEISEKFSLLFPENLELADISFREKSRGIVSWSGGGDIQVNSQNLELLDSSILGAGIFFDLGSPESKSGDIQIRTKRETRLRDSLIINEISNGATGSAGNLLMKTEDLSLSGVSTVGSLTSGLGNAGNLRIEASGVVSLDSTGSVDNIGSTIGSSVSNNGVGKAGNIELFVRELNIVNGATVNTSTFGEGDAGILLIQARDGIFLDGTDESGKFPSTIGSIVASGAVGNGGKISIDTELLKATNGGVINASTFGKGNAGDINITVRGLASFDGSTPDEQGASGVGSIVGVGAVGDGGLVDVNAGEIKITNGAGIGVGTSGVGNTGEINLTVAGKVEFDGRNNSVGSGISSVVASGAIGNGKSIQILADSIVITRGAGINASTQGTGDASELKISARNSVYLDGINNRSRKQSFISTSVEPEAIGNGGKIEIFTNNFVVRDGAFISTRTSGKGNAGNIKIEANGETILESSQDKLFPFITTASDGVGETGSIGISTAQLTLDKGGMSTVSSFGNGGDIVIDIDKKDSQSFLLRNASLVTSTAGNSQNPGNGGNITINTPFLISLPNENSDIIANAFSGSGGNITINANAILNFQLQDEPNVNTLRNNTTNDISASSAFGSSGILNLNGLNTDPSQGTLQISEALTDPSDRIDDSCSPNSEASRSSFIITGRNGIPLSPEEPFPQPLIPTWVTLPVTPSPQTFPSTRSHPSPPAPALLEATTWKTTPQGIQLIAQSSEPVALPQLACAPGKFQKNAAKINSLR